MSDESSQEPASPIDLARQHVRGEPPKRFYKAVSVVASKGGFEVQLDGRTALTPGRAPLWIDSQSLADDLVQEWDRVGDIIDPEAMPLTRLVNSAIDGVAGTMGPVRADIVKYAQSDLVCYRAVEPPALVERQSKGWDPVLQYAENVLNARFLTVKGIVHQAQPDAAIAAIGTRLEIIDHPLVLTALHSVTTLTGSALIAIAVAERFLSPQEAWSAAHVDEDWNISQWGDDDQAALRRAAREREFSVAASVLAS